MIAEIGLGLILSFQNLLDIHVIELLGPFLRNLKDGFQAYLLGPTTPQGRIRAQPRTPGRLAKND